jgi:hypothetical protein
VDLAALGVELAQPAAEKPFLRRDPLAAEHLDDLVGHLGVFVAA